MTLEDAKRIFGIETLTKDIDIKKIYRSLVFANHPDAHPENSSDYEEKIKIINEAYSILEHNTFYEEIKSDREEKEEYEKNRQIKKVQILTDIIVKTYYQSQSEINKLRENLLSSLINKVSKLNLDRRKEVTPVLSGFMKENAEKEADIMRAFAKQNVKEFMKEYQLEFDKNSRNYIVAAYFEPLYFLEAITDWYEKVIERENIAKIEDNNKHTL